MYTLWRKHFLKRNECNGGHELPHFTFVYLHKCVLVLAPLALPHSSRYFWHLASKFGLVLLLGSPVVYILYITILFGSLFYLWTSQRVFFLIPCTLACPVSAWVQAIPMPGNVLVGSLQHGVYLPVGSSGAAIKILHIHLFASSLWLTSHIGPQCL